MFWFNYFFLCISNIRYIERPISKIPKINEKVPPFSKKALYIPKGKMIKNVTNKLKSILDINFSWPPLFKDKLKFIVYQNAFKRFFRKMIYKILRNMLLHTFSDKHIFQFWPKPEWISQQSWNMLDMITEKQPWKFICTLRKKWKRMLQKK